MKKILTVIGARPQFIKAAAVSRKILEYSDLQEVLLHTGQHFDPNMSDIFFEQMNIPKPKYQLNINSLSHGAMTGRMLEETEKIIMAEKPDYVLVYGDTNSTLAGALAAKKLHVKVAHIEAGLRSFNMNMPEEINRILTDRISDLLFCPTDKAVENLGAEGFGNFDAKIIKSGDVMQDTALMFSEFAKKPSFEIPAEFVLATVHRAENTDDLSRLKQIFRALSDISAEIPVVLPLHPRTQKIVEANKIPAHNILIVPPVGYLEIIYLLKHSKLVMTDSGGMQKEAFFFGSPCITLRDESEWVELIENQYNMLAGADYRKIMEAFEKMKNAQLDFSKDLYGNGRASSIIVKTLAE